MKQIIAVFAATLVIVLVTFAPLGAADKPAAPELYGLYCWAGNYIQYADDVQRCGIRWLRVGGWECGEKTTDQAALLAAKNGVNLTPSLDIPGLGHGKTMPADQAVAKMRQVARDNVKRYGPGGSLWKQHPDAKAGPIRYWEIWNEPNIEFLTPPNDPNGMLRTELYAKLLTAASEEIRKLDPGAVIVAFNTAGGAWDTSRALKPDGMFKRLKYIGWRKFIRDVNELAGTKCYDVVGTHPYTKPRGPEPGKVIEGIAKVRELGKEQRF
ncbi:MAG TPA: hypothetical protein VNA25_14340, partial [Phycisphaerae bacterium]|nr:hypothetical protein [Phycisphaerae bacterium]